MVIDNKIVLFGAGKIGRSFIGQLFSTGGFEVVFIDVYKTIIDELNRRHEYNVIIKAERDEVLNIKNVRGVYAGDENKVVDEIVGAKILAVSVGQCGLGKVVSLLAKGLQARYNEDNNSALDIIIAENMRNAADYFYRELKKYLPVTYPINRLVGLVETSIGKMVPIMLKKDIQKDILQVFAEPYNTLIVDKKAFKNPIPDTYGLAPKNNIKAWVDRKLFIHNLSHAATAYLGYMHNPRFVYLYEALGIPEVYKQVRETVLQAAVILLKKYPDEFTLESLTDHIDDLLTRFQNKALGDTLFRVGADLKRKLGPEDRITGAIKIAQDLNLPYDRILYALVCGCHFQQVDEDGIRLASDIEFAEYYAQGIKNVLIKICGFDEVRDLKIIKEAEKMDLELKSKRNEF
jgi:mannitol-1-phosphate 5-dehydrogenase